MDFLIRQNLLIGNNKTELLKRAAVAIIGVGGVGGGAAESIARCGVGRIILVDNDTVNLSNKNRQIVALDSTLGRAKVSVMRERILDINKECEVIAINDFYSEDNSDFLFDLNPDYIIDCIDSVPSKIHLIKTAHEKNVRILSAAGAGNKVNPFMFEVAKLEKTSVCPLCRALRQKLIPMGVKGHMVVYSKEIPAKLTGDIKVGSISFVPPAVGMMMASVVARELITPE